MTATRRAIIAVLVVGAAALAPVMPARAPAVGPVEITTFAGGIGAGLATSVGQTPGTIAIGSGVVYVADTTFNVVRAVDVVSGASHVVAGTGALGYAGDGELATAASLRLTDGTSITDPPPGLALDGSGNLYIADTFNHAIRKVTPAGIISTVTGNGAAGFVDGAAASARYDRPSGIAFDSSGNLFIADSHNHRVRKLVATFTSVTTIAGNGSSAFGGDNGSATSASLNTPTGVAVDAAGVLYIADKSNCRVRKVAAGTITTYAGTTTCGFAGDGGNANAARLNLPYGVALDAAGNLYIADKSNCLVRKVATGTTTISSVAGTVTGAPACGFLGDGGDATAAKLRSPTAVAVAGDGTMYVADGGNHRVRRVTAGGTIVTFAGNGTPRYSGDGASASDAQLNFPYDAAVAPDGTVYVSDSDNNVIRRIGTDGVIRTVAGDQAATPGWADGAGSAARFRTPRGIAVAANGDVYIADEGNCLVRKLTMTSATAGTVSTVAGATAGVPNCGFTGDLGPAVGARLNKPTGVAVTGPSEAPTVYVADMENNAVRVVVSGQINTIAGGPSSGTFDMPRDVAVDGAGMVYVADTINNRVMKLAPADPPPTYESSVFAGSETGDAGYDGDGGPAIEALLELPYAVEVGPDGVYVADTFNDVIRKIDADGNISTAIGSSTRGFAGDGGTPTAAHLDRPQGFAVTDGPLLFVADTFNHRVRRVGTRPPTVPGAPSDIAASAADAGASVTWSEPLDDGGLPIESYVVRAYQGSTLAKTVGVSTSVSASSVYVSGLANGTAYTFTVAAKNAVGESAASAPSNEVTPVAAPVTPTTPAGGSGPGGVGGSSGTGAGGGAGSGRVGYWMLGVPGNVFAFGDAVHAGDAPVGGVPANDIEATPSGNGYWVVDAQGHVFTFGDAGYFGGFTSLQPGEVVTSLSATPSGQGYRLFTSHGRVAALGDADHLGDMTGTKLNGPVLDSTTTPSGRGYYMVASDGGVFTFGDAVFHGSMGHTKLNQPVQSLTSDPDGTGYWLVASDGGIFAFEAVFHGSMGDTKLNKPVTGMVPFGNGYLMVGEDGGIFTFGEAVFRGSLGASPPPFPITAVAPLR